MSQSARELRSIAEDIQKYARRIRRDPRSDLVETWARKIVRLTEDLESTAQKLEREAR